VIEELLVDGEPFDPKILDQPLKPPQDENAPPGQSRPISGGVESIAADKFRFGVKGDELAFSQNVMFALPDVEIVVTFINSSSANSHNLVIVQAKTKDAVAEDGIAAGPDNDWVPPGDPRVIANTPLLAPGSRGEARFMAPAPGEYQFVCTFPGHNSTMFGDFIVLSQAELERKP
jgi:azurin